MTTEIPDIEINLYSDWVDLICKEIPKFESLGFSFGDYRSWKKTKIKSSKERKKQLTEKGQDTSQISQQLTGEALRESYKIYQVQNYVQLKCKLIHPKPREIKYSSKFECSAEFQKGLSLIKEKVLSGESLLAHLSKDIFKAVKQDGMLFEWGIHHLHLGVEPHPQNHMLVERNNDILYAIFENEYAYFLVVDDHGRWADNELMELVKTDFPHLIEPYKMNGIQASRDGDGFSAKEREKLRRSGVTVATEIDGECYISRGGGMMVSGFSMKALNVLNNQIYKLNSAEQIIKEEFSKYLGSSTDESVDRDSKIKLRMLQLEDDRISLTDENGKYALRLFFDEEGRSFKNLQIETYKT